MGMRIKHLAVVAVFLMLVSSVYAGVEEVGKWVQLPNPSGWDVAFTNVAMLADDWQCDLTGPVTDIHFWYSWKGDQVGRINSIQASIWSNKQDGYSHPGDPLWSGTFYNFHVEEAAGDYQGWFDPATASFIADNHEVTWLATIDNIPDPFEQVKGTIYWLALKVTVGPIPPDVVTEIGWKTTKPEYRWNDDAVFKALDETGSPVGYWQPLEDPLTHESLDLAFAITTIPEPVSIVIWGLGAAGVAGALALRRTHNTRARWSEENRNAIVGLIEKGRKR